MLESFSDDVILVVMETCFDVDKFHFLFRFDFVGLQQMSIFFSILVAFLLEYNFATKACFYSLLCIRRIMKITIAKVRRFVGSSSNTIC